MSLSERDNYPNYAGRLLPEVTTGTGETNSPRVASPPQADLLNQPFLEQTERYEIIELIGQGGMGQVYKAYDRKTNQEVAVKLALPFRPQPGQSMSVADIEMACIQCLERLEREAKTLARRPHPHIVTVLDVLPFTDSQFPGGKNMAIIMEYLSPEEGWQNLRQLSVQAQVKAHLRHRLQQPAAAITIVDGVIQALLAQRRQGIVFRDINPGNIMCNRHNLAELKLIDAGIANWVRPDSDQNVFGSAYYLSPERWQALPNADAEASDVYILGLLLTEILTGQVVCDVADNSLDIMRVVCSEDLRGYVRNLLNTKNTPTALEDIIVNCVAPAVGNRPASLAELRQSLQPWVGRGVVSLEEPSLR